MSFTVTMTPRTPQDSRNRKSQIGYNQRSRQKCGQSRSFRHTKQRRVWVPKAKKRQEKPNSIKSERNLSNGTILYCPPNTSNKSLIISIGPNQIIPSKPPKCIRLITMGCTHEFHRQVYIPNGDMLIHAGDTCNWRRYDYTSKMYKTPYDCWKDFVSMLNEQRKNGNFKYGMYLIAGNHDLFVEENENKIKSLLHQNNIRLLMNESHTINISDDHKLKLFGSPISWYRSKPSCAYQVHRNEHRDIIQNDRRAKQKYFDSEFIDKYFEKSDILITHGPCAGYGDCGDDTNIKGRCTGSYGLLDFIHKTKPKLFICCDFHGAEYKTHGHGIHFIRFEQDLNEEQKENGKNDKFCIAMNVAIAHQPARHLRKNNVHRGVCIVDKNLGDIHVSKSSGL